jgi:Na+-driven multidrug efflux pump
VQILLRAGLVWGLTVIVQHKSGADGVAALGVTTRLDTMILFAGVGFASAATTVAGRAVAVGLGARARAAGLWAGVQALVFGGILVVTFQAGAVPLMKAFLPGAADPVVDAGILYLTVAAAAQPFAACAIGAMGAVQGSGRMMAPLLVDLIGFFVLATALLLATRMELHAVYGVLVAGAVLVALLHLLFLRLGRWTVPVSVSDATP